MVAEIATTAVETATLMETAIPEALIYEVFKGKPIYYRGWKQVLKNQKTIEQVMASSLIQAYLVSEINAAAHTALRKKYILGTNEAGLKFKKGDWRAADIAIWTKESLKGIPLHGKYSEVVPEIVVEVDTKADVSEQPNYLLDKTRQLHQNGVRRVIWVFTETEQTMIAEVGKKWEIQEWSESVEIAEGCVLNIADFIKDYDNQ